jgi:hypothetical protein
MGMDDEKMDVEAGVEAALDRLGAVDLYAGKNMTQEAKLALTIWVDKKLDARVGAAKELTTIINKAATEIVAHFSEAPLNWCACFVRSTCPV